MSKNLIPEVCKLLGVEIGEEFKIQGYGDMIFLLTSSGLERKHGDSRTLLSVGTLQDLLIGNAQIVKLPWKPKNGEKYWSFCIDALSDPTTWRVNDNFWRNDPFDVALFEKGWVYRTCEEAKAALPKVAIEIGVEYEL